MQSEPTFYKLYYFFFFFFLEPPYSKSSTYTLAAISLSTQIFDERPSILKYALLRFLLVKMVNPNTNLVNCKGALPGLRQLLATESSLKMMKNAFYFIFYLVILFYIHKIFKTFVLIFCHVEKRLDYEEKVDFKIYGATTWETNNGNKHIVQYLKK